MRPTLLVNTKIAKENIERIKYESGDKKLCFVVKAECYGLNYELAKRVEEDVDSFAVSYPFEGVELKKIGIKKPILTLMARDEEELLTAIINAMRISVCSFEMAERVVTLSSALKKRAVVEIKVDSGMNRFGVNGKEQFTLIYEYLIKNKIAVVGVFTHLLSDNLTSNQRQAEKFLEITKCVSVFKHITFNKNSKIIAKDFDGVRSGIDVLGGKGIHQCFRLFAKIIEIKTLKPFELLGYNFGYLSRAEEKIGIVSCGYADIAIKKLSNIGKAFVNGQKCDIIGNVCMDVLFISLKDIEDVKVGDYAEILGREQGILACDIAKSMGTNEYEVITSISKRTKRVYV